MSTPRLARLFDAEQLRRYLFEDVRGNPALFAKFQREVLSRRNPLPRLKALGLYGLNRVLQRHVALRDIAFGAQQLILRSASVGRLLQSVQPKIVVATFPSAILDAVVLREAEKLGMLTATELLSWDNVTAKGRFQSVSQRFLVWGQIMASEIRQYYSIDADRIAEVGVPHFDTHVGQAQAYDVGALLCRLGLRPSRPYLLFGMSSPYLAPQEGDIVGQLARSVSDDRFGRDMQLIIRLHPQNSTGKVADDSWLPRLQRLVSDRVAVHAPAIRDSTLAWNTTREDLTELGALLSTAAVALNSASTLSIDAILHDRPVVLTSFDADKSLPWWRSARRTQDYIHYAKLIGLKGLRVANSFDDMLREIGNYLDEPERDADGRARVRQQQCGLCDGRAAERVAEAIDRWIG